MFSMMQQHSSHASSHPEFSHFSSSSIAVKVKKHIPLLPFTPLAATLPIRAIEAMI
jgi:hypothetical protein